MSVTLPEEDAGDITPEGLYDKYVVQHTNPAKENKHKDCAFFVLDLTHDKAARVAVQAYIAVTTDTALAEDLTLWLNSMQQSEEHSDEI